MAAVWPSVGAEGQQFYPQTAAGGTDRPHIWSRSFRTAPPKCWLPQCTKNLDSVCFKVNFRQQGRGVSGPSTFVVLHNCVVMERGFAGGSKILQGLREAEPLPWLSTASRVPRLWLPLNAPLKLTSRSAGPRRAPAVGTGAACPPPGPWETPSNQAPATPAARRRAGTSRAPAHFGISGPRPAGRSWRPEDRPARPGEGLE